MSRPHQTHAARAAINAAAFAAIFTLGVGAALAQNATPDLTSRANVDVDGRFHSVTNGIPNYDGFDRFRDLHGAPLPG